MGVCGNVRGVGKLGAIGIDPWGNPFGWNLTRSDYCEAMAAWSGALAYEWTTNGVVGTFSASANVIQATSTEGESAPYLGYGEAQCFVARGGVAGLMLRCDFEWDFSTGPDQNTEASIYLAFYSQDGTEESWTKNITYTEHGASGKWSETTSDIPIGCTCPVLITCSVQVYTNALTGTAKVTLTTV